MLDAFQTMNGYRIVLLKPTPRMTLAENVPVTPEFREFHNAWALKFFGVKYIVPKGQAITDHINRVLYIREDDWPGLRSLSITPKQHQKAVLGIATY